MKPALRVVLDSNVFTDSYFDVVDQSSIRQLCKSGRLTLVMSGEMIEETLRSTTVSSVRNHLASKWLPLILEAAPRLCDDLPSIWRRELVEGRGRKASPFMSPREQSNVIAYLEQIVSGSAEPVEEAVIHEWREGDNKRRARRENTLQMRANISRGLKLHQLSLTPNFRPRADNFEKWMEALALPLIERFVAPGEQALGIFQRWQRNKKESPFFTQFVYNAIFQEVFFVTNHTAAVDVNASVDLDILTHLLHADAIVTNETKFMKSAFERIWKPQRKVLFDSRQFAAYMNKL